VPSAAVRPPSVQASVAVLLMMLQAQVQQEESSSASEEDGGAGAGPFDAAEGEAAGCQACSCAGGQVGTARMHNHTSCRCPISAVGATSCVHRMLQLSCSMTTRRSYHCRHTQQHYCTLLLHHACIRLPSCMHGCHCRHMSQLCCICRSAATPLSQHMAACAVRATLLSLTHRHPWLQVLPATASGPQDRQLALNQVSQCGCSLPVAALLAPQQSTHCWLCCAARRRRSRSRSPPRRYYNPSLLPPSFPCY
jgi:hypothetical protein